MMNMSDLKYACYQKNDKSFLLIYIILLYALLSLAIRFFLSLWNMHFTILSLKTMSQLNTLYSTLLKQRTAEMILTMTALIIVVY